MLVIKKEKEVREVLRAKRSEGLRIGLVPTMGALHQGHLSLVQAVKPHCGFTVIWIFLNPVQFNSKSDYERYPRTLEKDIELAAGAGVDLVFAPELEEIYPRGVEAYFEKKNCRVYAGDRSFGLCGAYRPGHFDGVAHVVTVFFNILQPDVAVFGEKDYQQVRVVQQLVDDLHLPVEIVTAPIIREKSGLAMSSRNELLQERSGGPTAISRALLSARDIVRQGERSAAAIAQGVRTQIESAGLEVEYVEVVDKESLAPLQQIPGQAQLLVAAYAGGVRLIDNIRLGGE